MATKRTVWRSAAVLTALVASTVAGTATAAAAELSDYRWERRPLLVFAPTDSDPRLSETVRRTDDTRCDFVGRDMVLGTVVGDGTSTLDGQPIGTEQSRRLADQFAVDEDAFSVILIGKDGGQKFRADEIPDLRAMYDLIDGMPMRSNEMSADPTRC